MARKDQFQTRLDDDHADQVRQYRDDHDLTNSEAVRRLIITGLNHQHGPSMEEIRDDLQEIRQHTEPQDTDQQVHVMNQMPAKVIGGLATLFTVGVGVGAALPI